MVFFNLNAYVGEGYSHIAMVLSNLEIAEDIWLTIESIKMKVSDSEPDFIEGDMIEELSRLGICLN
jgi:hypothetical protein